MNLEQRFKYINKDEVYWDWDNNAPYYNTKTPNCRYGSHVKFDPFPCYQHNKELLMKEISKIENLFPIKFDVFYFIFPYEPLTRTNGQASKNTIQYKSEDKEEIWDGVVEFHGKRIPIHPCMTRYLAAHEYGHIVDNWICKCRNLDYEGLDEEYAKMRGIENCQEYGGLRWHKNTGEIIANDFRICIGNSEIEFWPHDVKHPLECPNVIDFWKEMQQKYSYKNE